MLLLALAWVVLVLPAVEPEPAEAVALRKLIADAPKLPHQLMDLKLAPATEMEMVSSAAVDREGLIYILQRDTKADPILVTKPDGTLLRSWGRGLYTIPHSIRIDPQGNVWTVDAGDSRIHKFTAQGKPLLETSVELPDEPKGAFCGATDIAFLPGGGFLISDGYQNARVVEFDEAGKKVRQWGREGTAPGEFKTPHGIAIDPTGRVYVADRENGRIQWFDRDGNFQGMWTHAGKTFSLKLVGENLWIGTQPRHVPNGAEGWLLKLDVKTGAIVGVLNTFGHSIEVAPDGSVLTGKRPGSLLVFRP